MYILFIAVYFCFLWLSQLQHYHTVYFSKWCFIWRGEWGVIPPVSWRQKRASHYPASSLIFPSYALFLPAFALFRIYMVQQAKFIEFRHMANLENQWVFMFVHVCYLFVNGSYSGSCTMKDLLTGSC
jgi:hypothetical protein